MAKDIDIRQDSINAARIGTNSETALSAIALTPFMDSYYNAGQIGLEISGGLDADVLLSGSGQDTLFGGAGGDLLQGRAGDDILVGGAGSDRLSGGAGADVFVFESRDFTEGQVSFDFVTDFDPTSDILQINGFELISSRDDLSFDVAPDGLTVRLNAEHSLFLEGIESADQLTASSFEFNRPTASVTNAEPSGDRILTNADESFLTASSSADAIYGMGGSDVVLSGDGNDVIIGGEGDDLLIGGAGDDQLVAGSGSDRLIGGSGRDQFRFSSDRFEQGDLNFIDDFEAGTDRIRLEGFDGITGFNDLGISALPDGTGVRIDLGGGQVLAVRGVGSPADLTAQDFDIVKNQTSFSVSDEKIETTELVRGQIGVQSTPGRDLIGMDAFRNDAAFSGYTGAQQTIVVIDTGIDLDNAAFGPDNNGDGVADRIVYHYDFSRDLDGTANDVDGHGTHVASIAASSDARFLGVAPGTNIIALQALDNSGSGYGSDIEAALQWVVANASRYNIASVNLSLGAINDFNDQEGVHRSYGDELSALAEAGVLTVNAAGNSHAPGTSFGVGATGADPNAISVGAVWSEDVGPRDLLSVAKDFSTDADRITSFSQRSDNLEMVFAPGGAILGAIPGGGTAVYDGTSMAAPMVAGMAALSQEIANDLLGRDLTLEEFQRLLVESSDTLNDGDNEEDNVANLETDVSRVNMHNLAQAIQDLAGGPVPPAPDDDIANDTSTTAVLTADTPQTGTIETGDDQDWFRLDLQAGQTVTLDMRGSPTGDGTLSDAYLAVMDANGQWLATNDDGGDGYNAQYSFTVSAAGTYYLNAQSYGQNTGTYTVAMTTTQNEIEDDWAGDQSTGSVVATDGTPAAGTIDFAGDRDWHAVGFTAGDVYTIDVSGEGSAPLRDTYLRVYNEEGMIVAENDDGGDGLASRLQLDNMASGNYFIGVGAYADQAIGDYQITVRREPQDIANNPSTQASMTVDSTFESDIDYEGDRDWVAVSLQGGSVYEATLTGAGEDPLSDPYLRVYNGDSRLLFEDDDGGEGLNAALETFSVDRTGTYFLSAGAWADNSAGTYQIELNELTGSEDDLPADGTTSGRVDVGAAATSRLDFEGDRDWFAADVVAGQSYRVTLEGQGADPVVDPYLRVYDGNLTLLASNDDSNDLNSELVFTAGLTGGIYLSAGAYADAYEGDYEIAIAQTGSMDDFGGDTESSGTIARNSAVSGEIEVAFDHDWFALDATAGDVIEIAVEGSETGMGTLNDTVLTLRNEWGEEIAYNDDGGEGLNSFLVYEASRSETLYLDVGGYGDAVGTYTVSANVISQGGDDHGDTIGGSTAVQFTDGSFNISGTLETEGDGDMFAVDLTAGGSYNFAVNGTGMDALDDSTLTVYGPEGSVIAYDDDSGDDLNASLMNFEAMQSATHYVEVAGYGDYYTGAYTLSGSTVNEPGTSTDDFGRTPNAAGLVTAGGAVNGDLETVGDRDWVEIDSPSSGETISLQLRGLDSGFGSLDDPYLRLYRSDFDGSNTELVAYNDDGGNGYDSRLSYQIVEDGRYFAEVGGYADATAGTWQLDWDVNFF